MTNKNEFSDVICRLSHTHSLQHAADHVVENSSVSVVSQIDFSIKPSNCLKRCFIVDLKMIEKCVD